MFASARLDFAPTTDVNDKLSDTSYPFLTSLSETMNNAYGGRSSDASNWGRSAHDVRFSSFYSTPRAEGTRVLPPASSLVNNAGSYGAGAGPSGTHEALYAAVAETSARAEHFNSPHGMMSSPLHEQAGFAHQLSPNMALNHDAFSESHVRSQTAPANAMGSSTYPNGHSYSHPGHSSSGPMYIPSQQGHLDHRPVYHAYDASHGTYGNNHGYTSAIPSGMHPYASAVSSLDYRHHYLNPFEVKHRRRTTKSQFHILEGTFKEIPKPNVALRKALSVQLDMPPRAHGFQQIWFQNRRAKAKAMAKKEAAAKEGGEGTSAGASSSSSSSLPQGQDSHSDKREQFPHSLSDASSSSLLTAYSNQASSSSSTASDDSSMFQQQRVALTAPIQQQEHRYFNVTANEAWQYPNDRAQPYDNSQIYPSGLTSTTASPVLPESFPSERRASCPDVMPDLPALPPREHW